MDRINKCFDEMNWLSACTIKYGILLACSVVGIAIALVHLNTNASFRDLNEFFVSLEIAKVGISIFAEAIIAGLFIDVLVRRQQG